MIEIQICHDDIAIRESDRQRRVAPERLHLALILAFVGGALLGSPVSLAEPPANDECTGAIVIPDGPYPLVTTPVNVTDAGPQGFDDLVFDCAGTDRTIWYSFTPATTGQYTFTTCQGSGAVGSNVYDSVLAVLDSTGGGCPSGASLSCNDLDTTCGGTIPGAPYLDQSTVTVALSGGTTYFVVAGHWSPDAGGIAPGRNTIAVRVEPVLPPVNDTCANPTTLALNRVVKGTTAGSTNDYVSPSTAACFSGVGQTATTAPGLDVVFSFTAPDSGKYSIRYVQDDLAAALRSQNPVLYASSNCPAPAPSGPAVPCLKGANRITSSGAANGNLSEEIDCLPLTAGQMIYVFFDDASAGNVGGPLALEVTRCISETEPNGTPSAANAYSACSMTGSAASAGDVDFFDLGAAPAGSKLFAALDAVAANNSDFELRVTTATNTLGYDDNDGTSLIGSNAPVIAGVVANGSETYLRINSKSVLSEPYHLYARVESGTPQNEVDAPENNNFLDGNLITGGGFVRGVHATATDLDCYRFVANEGDNFAMFSDNNPARAAGTITNTWPVLYDLFGGPPTATPFSGQVLRNNLTASSGTLTGTTPSVTSEFWDYRARYTGTYMVCYRPDSGSSGPSSSAYPLPYQGSISLNCAPIPSPASRNVDVSVSMSAPAGPVDTGGFTDYTITLTNTGSDIAQDVRLTDTLPPNLVFLGVTAVDGFSGRNFGCHSLPTVGTADAPIDCTNFSIAPGASTTITLQVQVADCIGGGAIVSNTASITTSSTDPNPADDSSTASFTTSTDGTCADLVCNGNGCFPNLCTSNDHCEGTVCVSTPLTCSDNNPCTDDSCVPATGACVHAPDDGNTCSDGDLCTQTDTCHAGVCGGSDPLACGVSCPTGFISVAGGCRRTYDIDLSLLDDLQVFCDDTGTIVAAETTYGFHWTDLGGSLPAVRDVDVQIEAGLKCSTGPSSLSLNGVPAGGFDNLVGTCTCPSPHQTISFLDLDVSAYAQGGLNAISITPGPSVWSASEGLSANSSFGGNFARVTVTYQPEGLSGGPCTAGTCDPGTGTCSFASLPDGTACSSAACMESGTCQAGVCIGAVPVTCNAPPKCHTAVGATCDTATSACVYPVVANGSSCSDGNACTVGDTCASGTCAPGMASVCTPSDQCHVAGTCDPSTGTCSNPSAADGTFCNDGNACTQLDSCLSGACTGSNSITCTAADQCHVAGTCNPSTGTCSNPSAADGTFCNDGNACTQLDSCLSGGCTGSNPITCTAADQCHVAGTCNPNTGTCSNPGAPDGTICSDGNACTVGDTCQSHAPGYYPLAGLIQGSDGALYGTAIEGGSHDFGTVFKLNPDGTGYAVLTSFDGSNTGRSPDRGGLIEGTDGALYGTAVLGGSYGYGTVFRLNRDGTGFTVLKYLDSANSGAHPSAGLIQGTDGALYGTAESGGSYGYGTVFKLNTDGTGFSVLKNLDSSNTGRIPKATLLQGTDGALYGTAISGGTYDWGTLFKLNTDGTGFSVLKNFDSSSSGSNPETKLLQGADGALYGTTWTGGTGIRNAGTVFKLNPDGSGFAVLETFDHISTGAHPLSLIQGTDGALYSTTNQGGDPNESGTVFKINTDGTGFTILKHLDPLGTGIRPYAGLMLGMDGALYGTATEGGSGGVGTVFKIDQNGTGAVILTNFSTNSVNTCAEGTATLSCDDGNPCTDDSCNPASGCVHTNNAAACDDGNACTQTDTCQAGACVGVSAVTCTASDQCHDPGVCNPGTGVCPNPAKADGSVCGDAGTQCTNQDTCVAGVCQDHGFKSSATSCTGVSQGGPCDEADHCSGTSNACVDVFKSSATTCRASVNPCDVAESCTGSSGVCPADASIGSYEAHYLAPLNEGLNNLVQRGKVVPVKVSVTCGGVPLPGLTPAIQLLTGDQTPGMETAADEVETLSASAADTAGVMRPADSMYLYNLQVPSTASVNALFTIRVRPTGTSGDMRVVLKVRK